MAVASYAVASSAFVRDRVGEASTATRQQVSCCAGVR